LEFIGYDKPVHCVCVQFDEVLDNYSVCAWRGELAWPKVCDFGAFGVIEVGERMEGVGVAETDLSGDKVVAQDELAVGAKILGAQTVCASEFCVRYARGDECPELLREVWRMVVCF
jgi:hypothetical protein